MIRFKKRNTAWLAALALLTAVGMAAASTALGVQALLLAIFVIAAIASTVEIGRERESLLDALRRAPVRQRVSPQAKEATEQARARGGFVNNNLLLLDTGLIAVQSSYEGMAMRRTRSVSKDDDGVRPFIIFNVSPAEAERNAMIRFEIYDQYGERQFVHEMRKYLREGEANIMADHHLPLTGNKDITGTGDWDLRVFVDGNLVAMHNFMLAPSMRERQQRLTREHGGTEYKQSSFEIVEEVAEEVPPRLQDLLQEPKQSRSSTTSTSESNSRRASTRRRR